jgi:putative membrane protein
VVAGLLARGAAVHADVLLVVPAAVVAVSGLSVLAVLVPRRQRDGRQVAASGGDARVPRTAELATGLVVLAALCALAGDLLIRLR